MCWIRLRDDYRRECLDRLVREPHLSRKHKYAGRAPANTSVRDELRRHGLLDGLGIVEMRVSGYDVCELLVANSRCGDAVGSLPAACR